MSNEFRCLAVYDWVGGFDFSLHPEILSSIAGEFEEGFRKVAYFPEGGEKERKRTVSKNYSLQDILSSIEKYSSIEIDKIEGRDYSGIVAQIRYRSGVPYKYYFAAKWVWNFSSSDSLSHLKTICRYIEPSYGMSLVGERFDALFFVGGVATTNMDRETAFRATSLATSLRQTKEHLAGKMHDVYELNVLSPKHLERAVCGQPLWAWIGAGGRGELIRITDNVTAWLVPDDIRPGVRQTLFSDGALIATV